MKRIGLTAIIFCSMVILPGCWDRTEINDVAFVVASGVDKGKNKTYRVSVEIPLPSSLGGAGSSGGGGGTSGQGPFFIAQGTGANSRIGLEDIQERLSRKIYFGHRRVLIIGEEMAKSGITEILNAVFIQPQSRLSTFLLISKGDAVKILKTQPRMEQYSGEAIREMAKGGANITVKDVLEDLNRQGKDAVVPLIEQTGAIKKEKNGTEVLMQNFAILKGDKLGFITNETESRAFYWLDERMRKRAFSFSVGKNKEISIKVIDNSVNSNFHLVNGKPSFDLKVRATGILLENEPNLRIEDPKTYHFIINKMEEGIKKDIVTLLNHAHSQGVDVYGFGWYLFRTHTNQWKNNWKDRWAEELKDLKVNVTVDADIQRTTNSGLIEKE